MIRKKKNYTRQGQVLLEALVALSALTVGFLGVLGLISQSISLNRVIADNHVATYLAAEGVEVIKNLIDHNVFLAAGGGATAWNQGFADGCYEVDYQTLTLPPQVGCNSISLLNNIRLDTNTGLYDYTAGGASVVITPFKRYIRVTKIGGDELQVVSTVWWTTRGGGTFTADIETRFFNWATQSQEF